MSFVKEPSRYPIQHFVRTGRCFSLTTYVKEEGGITYPETCRS